MFPREWHNVDSMLFYFCKLVVDDEIVVGLFEDYVWQYVLLFRGNHSMVIVSMFFVIVNCRAWRVKF